MILATGLHDDVAAALDMPGGYYREEDSDGNAVVPSWWLHADSSASLNDTQDLSLITLDIWHESLGDLYASLEAVEFLKLHTAGRVTYKRQSITVLHEEQNVHHASVLIGCTDWGGP